jgi:hypothetical protein
LLLLTLILAPGSARLATAQPAGRYYSETGYTLAPEFVTFYDSHGGVPLLGYPVSEAHEESGFLVQWTERQRLEWHPEHSGTDFEVQLGLLGRELTRGLDGPRFRGVLSTEFHAASSNGQGSGVRGQGSEGAEGAHYFPETGQYVDDLFFDYWQQNGGLPVFGYPISQSYTDDSLPEAGGASFQTQWFERARFELHPENMPSTRVLLGHLGYEALKARGAVEYKFEVYGNLTPDSNLQIGLAQGGESADPAFFDNIRSTGSDLGPGLVRLDNIFNFYDIVQRGADGLITYRWDKLDTVLQGVRAMGKEALICLSYMPETLSITGSSRVMPPASYDEWAALVTATVKHVNIDRNAQGAPGVRYWEVWNEPDQWGFWQAPYPEYLHLYDVTVQAALAGDPTIKLGGPSVSYFSTDHLGEFLEHERWQVQMGLPARVDFLSWHSYGKAPEEVAADIRHIRKILEGYPQFSPEIFITEFNVLQGGAGDTSANGYTDTVQGAIAFLSSIESMQREGLDRAFLFELKDGRGATSYWGRWGILTNDGQPKPIYYALKAFQKRPKYRMPVSLKSGPTDGTLGMMAYGDLSSHAPRATVMLWYTGPVDARVKVALPAAFDDTDFDVTLFDARTNNLAGGSREGRGAGVDTMPPTNAGDLVFDLKRETLLIMTSR